MTATRDHRRAWDLIPWYVNGTLGAPERDLVQAHLESCPECRDEVELCRRLVEAGGPPEELAPSPHPAQLDRLMSRIAEDGEGRGGPGERGEPAAPPAVWHRLPSWSRAAAAILAVVLAGGTGYFLAPGPEPTAPDAGAPSPAYRTLSGADDPLESGDRPSETRIRMVFAPDTPEEEIRRILLEVDGEIVGGPTPLGVYTVQPNARAERADPIPVVLHHLRNRPSVRFAEAVGGSEPVGDPKEGHR